MQLSVSDGWPSGSGTEGAKMKLANFKETIADFRPKQSGVARHAGRGRPKPYRLLPMLFSTVCAVMLAHGSAIAADRATCTMAVKLLETIDRGLEAAAAGDMHGPTSGITVFAEQTQNMANQHSADDPLPDEVIAALSAILAETTTQYFIATSAPVLLEQALVIQQAMPDICADSDIPDLNRH